jgi:hypothetical protein
MRQESQRVINKLRVIMERRGFNSRRLHHFIYVFYSFG